MLVCSVIVDQSFDPDLTTSIVSYFDEELTVGRKRGRYHYQADFWFSSFCVVRLICVRRNDSLGDQ